MTDERIAASRLIPADPADILAVLRDPDGHVAIDSSGMLQSAEGGIVEQEGDAFLVHMDREALGDYDLGRYDVTVRSLTRAVQSSRSSALMSSAVIAPDSAPPSSTTCSKRSRLRSCRARTFSSMVPPEISR